MKLTFCFYHDDHLCYCGRGDHLSYRDHSRGDRLPYRDHDDRLSYRDHGHGDFLSYRDHGIFY